MRDVVPDRAPPRARPPLAAALGTALFVTVVPGSVVVLVPWLVTRWHVGPPFLGGRALRAAGVLLVVAALPVFLDFVLRFVREGHGTPAPVAPTRFLVRGGAFRWVRNPGYVAVVGLIVGQALVFGSPLLLLYAATLGAGFHVFVVLYEEPTLRRTFGREYDDYCRAVPRWLPRRPRAPQGGGGTTAPSRT